MSGASLGAIDPAHARMDRMYRHQRHIYDLTRAYYLFGRDRALDALALPTGGSLCEVGCGTARNLIKLARRRPDLRLYGVDASAEMLATARAALERAGLAERVRLGVGTAQHFDPAALFAHTDPLDCVLFSYSLSMMPDRRAAIEHALSLLVRPGGTLAIVDFGELEAWPSPARALLRGWLRLFHVHPSPDVGDWLARRAAQGEGVLRRERLGGGYAELLLYRRQP